MRQKGYTGLGVEDCPIDLEDILGFKTVPQVFQFRTHKLRKLSENYDIHVKNQRYQTALRQISIKLAIEEGLGNVYEYLDSLGELADIQTQINQVQEAI